MPDGEEADQVRAGFHRHLENLNRAVWHELGTSRIPPRPFLAPALYQNEALIKKAVGEVVRDYLAAGRMDFDFLSAALHAVDQGYDIGVNVAPDFFQLDYLLVARHAFVACQLVKRRLSQLHHVVVCHDAKQTPFLPSGSPNQKAGPFE
jgi:hypothetical protein